MPKKETLQVNKLKTSWPDYLLLYLLIRNNQNRQILGKKTRQIIWWRIIDCSLASDVWSVAIWSDQSIKHNALQIAVSHSKIMLLMELQNFILPLYCILFYILLEILCICSGQCLPMEGKVKWNETPHKSWSCCFSWRIITNMHCKYFLVHNANKDVLGLNPYNAHHHAANIFTVGGGGQK